MSSDVSVLDLAAARNLFCQFPTDLQWPTLSPDYVAADSCREDHLKPIYFGLSADSGLFLFSMHQSQILDIDACDWQSPYGYGGPIQSGYGSAVLSDIWDSISKVAARRNVVAEFIRFHPGLNNQQYYSGESRLDRAVVLLNLKQKDLMTAYSGRARTAVRKALKQGVQSRWLDTTEMRVLFPGFYKHCMTEIGATSFYFFRPAYFDALFNLDCVKVLGVYDETGWLSMGMFLYGPKQVEYHLSGTSASGRLAGATNLLIHCAATDAQAAGKERLYLGGGTTSSERDPLLQFKSSFGPATCSFHIGYKIYSRDAYERLRQLYSKKASSERILFYRD
jgi:hypothetical protein